MIHLDDRILEYDIDKVLYEGTSPFQKIQIVHSKSLGNMLVLDELQSEYWSWLRLKNTQSHWIQLLRIKS